MIPEKWDAIYLYASIIEESFKKPKGEMFFYYFPKGILKKNPINVYEIPGLFNIDEETYNELINKLFLDIKRLREISRDKHPVLWTSITITIEGFQFKIEYNYDDLDKNSEFNPYERHVIWRYEYLKLDFETLNKTEKEIIHRYINSDLYKTQNRNIYTEGVYKQVTHNIIDYAKTISLETAIALQQGENEKESSPRERLELLKRKSKKLKDTTQEINSTSNQILFGIKQQEENAKEKIDDDINWEDELLTTEKMTKRTIKKDNKIEP